MLPRIQSEVSGIGLLIPVFNVAGTITRVLEAVAISLSAVALDVLIIDNNSNDHTITKIKLYLQSNPELAKRVTLMQHARNYGYGCSIKSGFEYFSKKTVSHVMIIHGDHQVDPAWLINRLTGIIRLQPEVDLVLASRFKPDSNIENYSLVRRIGNYFFNAATTFCSGHKMSDSGTAMIIVRNSLINKIEFHNLSNSWQFHPQLNILLYNIPGIQIVEVSMDWADSEVNSTVPLFRYGIILLKMLLMYWFKINIMHRVPQDAFPCEPVPFDRKMVVLTGL